MHCWRAERKKDFPHLYIPPPAVQAINQCNTGGPPLLGLILSNPWGLAFIFYPEVPFNTRRVLVHLNTH